MPTQGSNVLRFVAASGAATGEMGGNGREAPSESTPQVVSPVQRGSAPSFPQVVTLQDLGNGEAFMHPLYLRLEQAGEEWVATSLDLSLVGRGESDLEAIDDLRAQTAELFDSLREMRDTLGPYLQNQLAFLERLAGVR